MNLIGHPMDSKPQDVAYLAPDGTRIPLLVMYSHTEDDGVRVWVAYSSRPLPKGGRPSVGMLPGLTRVQFEIEA